MTAKIAQVPQNYGIQRWGAGYFGINERGRVIVRPDPGSETIIDLFQLTHELRAAGLALPVLVRFVDILYHRVRQMRAAFAAASEQLAYRGRYLALYPIKVNQQHSVIEHLLAADDDGIGLEAGSKPELLAILAAARPGGVIVCNGYKDCEYIRLALIGSRMGHRIYIVIEKPSEIDLVLKQSTDLGIEPLLGVRVRLAAVAHGNWQNSGGEKSKFGLSAPQLLSLVGRLVHEGCLHWLQLLHSHIGSQIPKLRDISRGLVECARYYAELRRLGAPISAIDVGGGLGVDYDGTGTRNFCSMDYSVEGYARETVRAFQHTCEREGLPHPDLFTESGRAMTAHHAVLLTNVIGRESALDSFDELSMANQEQDSLRWLYEELTSLDDRSPVAAYQEARYLFATVQQSFERGELSLEQRAWAERLYFAILRRIKGQLVPTSRYHRELLERLNELLADRLFCNFSVFQSLPDVWAIDQIFPLMPLDALDRDADTSAILHDLTCDSDGCIRAYVDQDGVESTLPLYYPPSHEGRLLGVFLAGAYQEILGDMHNLFGDTNAVNIALDRQGGYKLSHLERGDRVADLLLYVHFDPEQMLRGYRRKLQSSDLKEELVAAYYRELEAGLGGYTYLGN
jgi:arginine decarboxylase